MPRYRSDTPAARRRDAPARARRVRRLALGAYAGVCLAALAGLVATTPGSPPPEHNTAALASASGDERSAKPSTAPAGHVHISGGPASLPLPADWPRVRPMLAETVEEAAAGGHELTLCVRAIDVSTEPMVCAGEGTRRYAASVTKLASAVAALETWEGDAAARVPLGVTLGDLVDEAISVSDNYAADQLTLLTAAGPEPDDEADTDNPFELINAITARVGLDERFHAGNYYTEWYWSDDWSHVDAAGAALYLSELIRAADGEGSGAHTGSGTAVGSGTGADTDELLTAPEIARHVLDAMLAQERRGKIPAELPEGTTANKTGETDTVSHDLAVLNTEQGRVVMSMVSTAGWLGDGPHELVAETTEQVVSVFGGSRRF